MADVESLLCNPFRHAVDDAKWRVTTLRQRMAKLQEQLDEAIVAEEEAIAKAEQFIETGKIPDDFFPDLSPLTKKLRKEYRKIISDNVRNGIKQGNVKLAKKIDSALEAAGIEGWHVGDFDTDGYVDRLHLTRLSPEQGSTSKVRPPAIIGALENSIKAYYTVWADDHDSEVRTRAEQGARAALKAFYEFDGSESPDDYEIHEDSFFDLDAFKEFVAFDHRDYELPSRPRGQHLNPFQIKVVNGGDEQTAGGEKRPGNGTNNLSGHDPPQ